MAFLTLFALFIVIAVVAVVIYQDKQSRLPLPSNTQQLPGPVGLPVIGSAFEVPDQWSWMKFHEWGQKYGPIYQCNLAGTNHVWISTDEIATELLSKRSAIYSDRPFLPALEQDNRTSGQYLPLMSRNEKWARQRKFAKQIMDSSLKDSFYRYPELESVRLLFELMADPSRYNHHLESFIARVTSRLAWGTSAPSEELKQRARELLIGVSPTGSLGNKLPFIMSMPENMVKAKAWEMRRARTERKFFAAMQQQVLESMSSDGSQPKKSWTRMFLENKPTWNFASDLEGAFAVGMHGIAGALTIAAPMQSFCLALCNYPQYQPILHEEIDRVLGERMPTFDDMPNMPVLRAFIRETMRWRPPVPTGIPHETTADDIYDGYFIPKGSVVHALEWSISREPAMYPDPDAWNPLRWLNSNFPTYREPLSTYPTITSYSQFGYGRRLCQGMGVTEADLFVGLGSLAWLFTIEGARESIDDRNFVGTPDPTVAPSSDDDCSERFEIDAMSEIESKLMPLADAPSRNYTPTLGRFSTISESSPTANDDLPDPVRETGTPDSPTLPSSTTRAERRRSQLKPLRLVEQMEIRRRSILVDQLPPSPAPSSPEALSATSTSHGSRCSSLSRASVASSVSTAPSIAPVSGNPAPIKSSSGGYESDPTMNFSSLLIAKPMPFKFNLNIRNRARAEMVTKRWMELKMQGEFEDPRVYWNGGNDGDEQHGWGEVFA